MSESRRTARSVGPSWTDLLRAIPAAVGLFVAQFTFYSVPSVWPIGAGLLLISIATAFFWPKSRPFALMFPLGMGALVISRLFVDFLE